MHAHDNNKFIFLLQAGNSLLRVSTSMGSLCTFSESGALIGNRSSVYDYSGKPSVIIPILGCVSLLVLYITCGAAFVADTQNIDFT